MNSTKIFSPRAVNHHFKTKKYIKNRKSLNILFLIPHPFYQERGSPIADNMVLRILSERQEHVDVITYPEGKNINYKNITLYRTIKLPFVYNIRPGFSWKKVIYDVLIFIEVIRLISQKKYDLIHAVEETVFIALILKMLLNIPYVYDMDSSLVQQIIEKHTFLTPLKFILDWFEKIAVKNAEVVVPVCQALADNIAKYRPKKVLVLPDVSLLI
ncbi:glycosyltransferase [Pleurocapsales cyanobacterium LEGE 06147]|nr:glycosyltransferase [Pleurocapsales cyanobacterium LEGE 06147]